MSRFSELRRLDEDRPTEEDLARHLTEAARIASILGKPAAVVKALAAGINVVIEQLDVPVCMGFGNEKWRTLQHLGVKRLKVVERLDARGSFSKAELAIDLLTLAKSTEHDIGLDLLRELPPNQRPGMIKPSMTPEQAIQEIRDTGQLPWMIEDRLTDPTLADDNDW